MNASRRVASPHLLGLLHCKCMRFRNPCRCAHVRFQRRGAPLAFYFHFIHHAIANLTTVSQVLDVFTDFFMAPHRLQHFAFSHARLIFFRKSKVFLVLKSPHITFDDYVTVTMQCRYSVLSYRNIVRLLTRVSVILFLNYFFRSRWHVFYLVRRDTKGRTS